MPYREAMKPAQTPLDAIQHIDAIMSEIMIPYASIEANLGKHPNYTKAQQLLSEARTAMDAVRREIAISTPPGDEQKPQGVPRA